MTGVETYDTAAALADQVVGDIHGLLPALTRFLQAAGQQAHTAGTGPARRLASDFEEAAGTVTGIAMRLAHAGDHLRRLGPPQRPEQTTAAAGNTAAHAHRPSPDPLTPTHENRNSRTPLTNPSNPTYRILSLGAGVQSTTLLALSAEGILPRIDYAIFADTGWEPKAVYAHLERIQREIAEPAGIPVLRVTTGNIRNDALDPAHRFASMPLYILNKDGQPGMTRRQCTGEYKIKPIKKQVREILGYPYPQRIPKGMFVEQWVGISTDEFHRAKDADVAYMRNRHPLIVDMDWSRADCTSYLESRGLADTPKSSCLGCPFHGNQQWRNIRDNSPEEWEDVVAFDAAIRAGNARANASGNPLLGQAFLHRSRIPLDQAPIDHVTAREWAQRQAALDTRAAGERLKELEDGVADGCSPWACRGDEQQPEQGDFGLTA